MSSDKPNRFRKVELDLSEFNEIDSLLIIQHLQRSLPNSVGLRQSVDVDYHFGAMQTLGAEVPLALKAVGQVDIACPTEHDHNARELLDISTEAAKHIFAGVSELVDPNDPVNRYKIVGIGNSVAPPGLPQQVMQVLYSDAKGQLFAEPLGSVLHRFLIRNPG